MQWEKLLSLKKFEDTNKRQRSNESSIRNAYEVDFDRIVFSEQFRKLQDKTQVVPLSQTIFAHTRLTHSIEVAAVGRSLGRMVGQGILEKNPHLQELGYQINDFGAIVSAACLAHDIGNPPFGHAGESAIGHYFLLGNGQRYKNHMSLACWYDLTKFEGNANGFRILTENRNGMRGGLRLTYATLGAFMKYPKSSIIVNQPKVYQKKYNYFQQQQDFFHELSHELGLIELENNQYVRHPLAYVVEAADDICYSIIDFEDGLNLNWIAEEDALELILPLTGSKVREKYFQFTTKSERSAYLRAVAINLLVEDIAGVFLEHQESILNGQGDKSLLDLSDKRSFVEDIKNKTKEKVYNHLSVLERQAGGFNAIQGVLDTLTQLSDRYDQGNSTYYDKNVLGLLPATYAPKITEGNTYDRLLACCTFLSELTDAQLMRFHKTLHS